VSVVANVAINVDSRGATQKLREVQVGAKATEQAFNALTSAAAAFGAGFAIGRVIQDVKELDTNLRRLGTVGVDVGRISPALSSLSKELGGVASKAELAAASYQAASAGFSDTAGNIEILRASTKAATGGLADTQAVTEVLVKTLNAYGLAGTQASKVTDSISKAIELGNQEWSDYTSQLGRVISIAAIAGVSLDEVNAFIAAATKNGATAEIAFTGLGAAFNTLLQPTKESTEAAAALGIQWNIGGLEAKGFTGLLEELSKKQDANKETVARLLGSQEALRGVLAANSKAGKDYQTILEALGDATGKTQSDFDKLKGSLENQIKALDTAFKNLSEALGQAFGPAVADALSSVTKLVNGFADAIKAIPQPVITAATAVAKVVVQILLLQKAIQAIIALRAAVVATLTSFATTTAATGTAATASSSAFALYAANTKTLQAAAATTTPVLAGLRAVLANLASIGVITVGINLIVTGLQEALTAAAEVRRLRGERAAGGAAAIFGGSATAEQKATATKSLEAIRKEQQRLRSGGVIAKQTLLGPLAPLAGVPTTAQAGARRPLLQERARRAEAILALPTRVESTGLLPPAATPQAGLPGGEESSKKKGKTDAERAAEKAAREAKRLTEEIAKQKAAAAETLAIEKGRLQIAETANPLQQQITSAIVKQNDIQREFNGRLQESKSAEETLNLQLAQKNALQTNGLELQKALAQEIDQLTQPLDELTKASAERLAIENRYQKLLTDGINPQLAEEFAQLELAAEKQSELLTLRLAELEAAKAKLNAESEVAKALQDQINKIREILQLQQGQVDKSKKETEEEASKRQEREKKAQNAIDQAERLQALYRGIVDTIEDGIVNALSAGIEGLITGTKNLGDALKEIASGILKDIGQQLLRFGVNLGLRAAFPGAFAAEGAYWTGGFKAFAEGGLVTSPTMGMVGEGGEPEYIIPASKMRTAMGRYAAGNRGASVIPSSGEQGGSGFGNGVATMEPIDVRYSVERINNVDYVTTDQFQRGLAQAAQQGAVQGERRALRTLSNSPANRRRIGLG
jgi:TP901 family phage tail tape measure protein